MEIDEIECLHDAGYTKEEIEEYLNDKRKDELEQIIEATGCPCLNECQNKLSKQLPDIDKIIIIPESDKAFLKIKYKEKDLLVTTPRIFVPFGIDTYYKNWSINFDIKNKVCWGIK